MTLPAALINYRVLLGALLVSAIAACSSGGAQGNLTDDEQQALSDVAGELQASGYMRLIFPTYLPAGLRHEPRLFQTTDDVVSYEFLSENRVDLPIPRAFNLEINQYAPGYSDGGNSPVPSTSDCLLNPENLKCVKVSGEDAVLQVVEHTEGFYDYTLSFDIGEFGFILTLTWETQDSTDRRLFAETSRVVESMFEASD